ncbi:probable ATP-dependent RNA helicase DHX34 [Anneissia japonica]|uniref:probable ATP-dependent RNA helicase DHX34 n=1 Tax=Anneissia japonica TaxID=1529436 RepID=UPI0014258A62|nr:probable ATP-dependent RNA helicase DHX34 [Anneissia japonica]XP_033109818.1 probable ATP-dependent RNA helicase DHX34 [Anneissia japonica]
MVNKKHLSNERHLDRVKGHSRRDDHTRHSCSDERRDKYDHKHGERQDDYYYYSRDSDEKIKKRYSDSGEARNSRSSRKEKTYSSKEKETKRRESRKEKKEDGDWNNYGYSIEDIKEFLPPKDDKEHKSDEVNVQSSSAGRRSQDDYKVNSRDEKPNVKHSKQHDNDGLFPWERYRNELDRIFFRNEDFSIRRRSQEHDDFWNFFLRYQQFQSRRQISSKAKVRCDDDKRRKDNDKEIPAKRHNDSIKDQNIDDQLEYYKSLYKDGETDIKPKHLKEFKFVIMMYLDFCQKQKVDRLSKLREDQRNLPIYQFKSKIIEALQEHQVIIVAGDTGCGKSTQVPQYLMEAGYSYIACTQPRRIACISLAKRVSYETQNEYGDEVGYQIRFESSRSKATRIVFLTEGLLLRQVASESLLSQYNVIVIDEVHERHIHTDFLLGVLKAIVQQREDLKVVLMSATININLFSNYFHNAPVLQVPGRLYPITLEYVPIRDEETTSRLERLNPRPYLRIMQRIEHKYPTTERGDLLIFLSGMSEISSVVEAARMYASQTKRWIVLPLHSTLSISEQDKVFDVAPDGIRKCIVSTNIAETSVTIDGVRFIADSGKVKEMSYDSKEKMRKLQEFWISRASAEQRKGRAGRTGPGVCFRLYDESDYDEFQEYTTPEIHRVPLDSTLLQMIAMGLPNAREFPFIEPPPPSNIENSLAFLKEQNALTDDEQLTPVGAMLARLPVDVVIGKMLIIGTVFKMIDPILCIAASLSVQSPFTSKAHSNQDAMAARRSLESDHGDPFTLLNAYDEWVQIKADRSSTSRKWCRRRGLEEQRFYEMSKLVKQFKGLLTDYGLVNRKVQTASELTSYDRQQKYRDRKKLTSLKREHQGTRRKRKFLRLEDGDVEISEGEDDDNPETNIADLEFKLSNDLNQLQEAANVTRSFTLRDINLLKVILCSGLYPQLAIADDCNSYRKDTDQVFHTKAKPFVLLHPTGIFATNPDTLEPPVSDEESNTKKVFSNKHQLLAFVSLLETTKPYLVNTMRVPALQTMLLYAHSLDTNTDCTRVVADDWVEFKFQTDTDAQQMISSVVQLRDTWQKLLKMRLEDANGSSADQPIDVGLLQFEKQLAGKLVQFLESNIKYTMKKIAGSELQNLYIGPTEGNDTDNFFISQSKDAKPHPIKGGTQVNSYLTIASLQDNDSNSLGMYSSVLREHWTCLKCNEAMIVTMVERLQHQSECKSTQLLDTAGTSADSTSAKSSLKKLAKAFYCEICKQDFSLTSTEILKHKRSHKATDSLQSFSK